MYSCNPTRHNSGPTNQTTSIEDRIFDNGQNLKFARVPCVRYRPLAQRPRELWGSQGVAVSRPNASSYSTSVCNSCYMYALPTSKPRYTLDTIVRWSMQCDSFYSATIEVFLGTERYWNCLLQRQESCTDGADMFIGIIRTYERAPGTEVVETNQFAECLQNLFKVPSICQMSSKWFLNQVLFRK